MRSVVLKGSRLYYLVYNASWLLQVSIKFTKKKTSKETDMGIKWSLFIVQHTNPERIVSFVLDTDNTFNFHHLVTV